MSTPLSKASFMASKETRDLWPSTRSRVRAPSFRVRGDKFNESIKVVLEDVLSHPAVFLDSIKSVYERIWQIELKGRQKTWNTNLWGHHSKDPQPCISLGR